MLFQIGTAGAGTAVRSLGLAGQIGLHATAGAKRLPHLLDDIGDVGAAIKAMGMLAMQYDNGVRAVAIASRAIEHGMSDSVIHAAQRFAANGVLEERAGLMYGYLRMVNQGWSPAAGANALKYGGGHGLDGLFYRANQATGALEFAALESKTAGTLSNLARPSGLRQGEQGYIVDRLSNALDNNTWMSAEERGMLIAARTNARAWHDFSSYASIVDADRLIALPRLRTQFSTQSRDIPWIKPTSGWSL